MALKYWLLKTEPGKYSWNDLIQDGITNWDGVRNYQARNYLKECKAGDEALIYHSGKDKCIVGIAKIVKSAYADIDPQKKGEWVQVDIKPLNGFSIPVTLKNIKSKNQFKDLLLIKQSRLSVMPVNSVHFRALAKLGKN